MEERKVGGGRIRKKVGDVVEEKQNKVESEGENGRRRNIREREGKSGEESCVTQRRGGGG